MFRNDRTAAFHLLPAAILALTAIPDAFAGGPIKGYRSMGPGGMSSYQLVTRQLKQQGQQVVLDYSNYGPVVNRVIRKWTPDLMTKDELTPYGNPFTVAWHMDGDVGQPTIGPLKSVLINDKQKVRSPWLEVETSKRFYLKAAANPGPIHPELLDGIDGGQYITVQSPKLTLPTEPFPWQPGAELVFDAGLHFIPNTAYDITHGETFMPLVKYVLEYDPEIVAVVRRPSAGVEEAVPNGVEQWIDATLPDGQRRCSEPLVLKVLIPASTRVGIPITITTDTDYDWTFGSPGDGYNSKTVVIRPDCGVNWEAWASRHETVGGATKKIHVARSGDSIGKTGTGDYGSELVDVDGDPMMLPPEWSLRWKASGRWGGPSPSPLPAGSEITRQGQNFGEMPALPAGAAGRYVAIFAHRENETPADVLVGWYLFTVRRQAGCSGAGRRRAKFAHEQLAAGAQGAG